MAADFQNVYRYYVCLCSSVVLADVLEHNCNPAGENELSFLVGTCVFLSHSSVLPPELHRRKKLWILIAGFPDEMWMLQQPKEEILAFFSKKINFASGPIKRLARQEVQPPCFLLT